MDAVGIDFGTSTTVAAVVHDTTKDASQDDSHPPRPQIATNAQGQAVIPSVVAYPPTGQCIFGHSAKRRAIIDPHNVIFSVKRILGKPYIASAVKDYIAKFAVQLDKDSGDMPVFSTRAGSISAIDVASTLLAETRKYAAVSDLLDGANVGLSIPVGFDPTCRQALKEAALRAGFANLTMVEEPHAAAVATLGHIPKEQVTAVYDLGGGTFDLALLRWHGHKAEVLAMGGDEFLGGDDIDLRLAQEFAEHILKAHRWDVRTREASFQALVGLAEEAKITLSSREDVEVDLTCVDDVLMGQSLTINRVQLEKLLGEFVGRSFIVADSVFGKARLKPKDVDSVVLAGGSTKIPAIRKAVEAYFGTTPKATEPSDTSVAAGAALLAAR